jgi:glycosyltransferase involved in cell wall biosynthesis
MDDRLINRAKCSAKLADLMVAGRAIVADAVGEMREKLEHRISGWLTPPVDVEAQAAAIVALLEDAATRQALGDAARRRIWELYDWSQLAERAERAYAIALQ